MLGEKWTFLVIRDALSGVTRFADFRSSLGIAPDILTSRLGTLVESGVLEKVPYREPGSRQRHEYRLTAAGRELRVVLGALQQWATRTGRTRRGRPSSGAAVTAGRSRWPSWTIGTGPFR